MAKSVEDDLRYRLLPGDRFIACFVTDRLRKAGERAGAVCLSQ